MRLQLCRLSALVIMGAAGICWAYQERLILSMVNGSCQMRVEADDQSHTLRLRVLPEGRSCQHSRQTVQAILNDPLAQEDLLRQKPSYTSLFLGRLADYPWLSTYLATFAADDPAWDRARARPAAADLHGYVSSVLARKEILGQFDQTFSASGYRVVSVSVEKVLVSRLRDIPAYSGPQLPGKVPWDAMVWLNLEQHGAIRDAPGTKPQP